MSISSSNYAADAYVTAANPAPGRDELYPYLVTSGTGFEERYVTKSDGGIGLNVYLAGGAGPSGVIPVSQTNPVNISLSGVTIGGVITVTSSLADPVWITGSVFVLNPGGSSSLSGVLTATITGVVAVSQTNLPATQSVLITGQPIGVSGTVGVSGTASVFIGGQDGPLGVSGTVSVSLTGVLPVSQTNLPATQSVYVVNQTSGSVTVSGTASVSVTNFPAVVTVSGTGAFDVTVSNLPATQSVFVVNQASSSITGTVTVSGTGVFEITGSVFVLNQTSSSITGTVTVTSTIEEPVNITGTVTVEGITFSGGLSITQPSVGSPSVFPFQTSTFDTLLAAEPTRIAFSIYNDTNQTYLVCLGSNADVNTFDFSLFPQEFYESPYPGYTGIVTGIGYGSGSGNLRVKEMLP